MAQGTATSFAVPNFSGMLFAKGQQATPFSTMIGARPLVTNHVEFTCGQEYNTETGEQPKISETASLTAPQPEIVTRSQLTNVTQIFQKSVAISYGKQSNMGTAVLAHGMILTSCSYVLSWIGMDPVVDVSSTIVKEIVAPLVVYLGTNTIMNIFEKNKLSFSVPINSTVISKDGTTHKASEDEAVG